MLSQDSLESIKKTVEEFLEKMTFEAEVEILQLEGQTIAINIKTEEPQILIGERGETLMEIKHLLKLILRKKGGAAAGLFYVDLDINDYKKKKTDYLKELAKETAKEAVLNQREIALPPMPAYERRVIHLELSERKEVVSESFGDGQERRVVVKPRQQV